MALLLAGCLLLFGIAWIRTSSGAKLLAPLIFLGIAGLVFLVCLYYLVIGAGKSFSVIRNEQVQDITGRIRTRVVSGGEDSSDSYYYDIGQFSFDVSEPAFNAAISGVLYQVYYLPSLKKLVSVEPIETPVR